MNRIFCTACCTLVLSSLAGCADTGPPAPREFNISSMLPPEPADLVDLAASIRAEGGFVVIGEPTSSAAADPDRVAGPENVFVEYPLARSSVTVVDDLNAGTGSPVTILGSSGLPRLVDAMGAPAEGWVLSGTSPDAWTHRLLPSAGTYAFFATPNGPDSFLRWAAVVVDGMVDGAGTTSGRSVSVEELRGPPLPLAIGGLIAPPDDLITLSRETRMAGGHVFVGEVSGEPQPLAPVTLPGPEGVFVEYPRGVATVVISARASEIVADELDIVGATGEPRLVDADGLVSTRWVVSSGQDWSRAGIPAPLLPRAFFVVPSDDGWTVRWVAGMVDGLVDGSGTRTGASATVGELGAP